ncbi:MAG: glycosyltransferase family 4 protein [Planctomycetaceae bacterium]
MLPALEGGGVEQGTLEIGRALVRAGHRSIVISAGGRMVNQLEADGSEHHTWPVSKSSLLRPLAWVWRLRELLRSEHVDILHVRSRHPAWLAWLAWRGMSPNQRPVYVTTAHGLYSPGWYSAVMARGERVIAISETVRSHLLTQFARAVRDERIQVIFRGVNPENFHPQFTPSAAWLADWRARYPQLVDRPVITLPGRLTRLKGHHAFLNVIASLRREIPDVQGLIVGGAHPRKQAYAAEIRQSAAQLGLDNVHFTGHRSDLREILSVSNVVLSLTSNPPEAFGRTVLEALSLGRPVVGYEHAGPGEVLRTLFPSGGVAADDTDAVCNRTLDFLRGPVPDIAPNRQFTEQQMCAQTLDLYRRAA